MRSFLRDCKKNIAAVFLVVTVAAIGTSQATIVPLGTMADFAVLDDSAATDADASTFFITGDAGSSSMSSVMAFPYANVDGILCLATDTATLLAHMIAEYNAAFSATGGVTGPADLGGATLAPGVYIYSSTAPWTAGTLTPDGQFNPSAQWISQIGTAMATPADTTVSLINNASTNNVFWQVGSSLTLGINSVFAGSIIANTSVILKAERGENI